MSTNDNELGLLAEALSDASADITRIANRLAAMRPAEPAVAPPPRRMRLPNHYDVHDECPDCRGAGCVPVDGSPVRAPVEQDAGKGDFAALLDAFEKEVEAPDLCLCGMAACKNNRKAARERVMAAFAKRDARITELESALRALSEEWRERRGAECPVCGYEAKCRNGCPFEGLKVL